MTFRDLLNQHDLIIIPSIELEAVNLDADYSDDKIQNALRTLTFGEYWARTFPDLKVHLNSLLRINHSKDSAHRYGFAIDLSSPKGPVALYEVIKKWLLNHPEIAWDQLILESNWVHFGLASKNGSGGYRQRFQYAQMGPSDGWVYHSKGTQPGKKALNNLTANQVNFLTW